MDDAPPALVLQELIEHASAIRHAPTELQGIGPVTIRKANRQRRLQLHTVLKSALIPQAARADDQHIEDALRRLDVALDRVNANRAADQDVLVAVHFLLRALEFAPVARREAD